MAKRFLSLFLVSCLLGVAVHAGNRSFKLSSEKDVKDWCVVQGSAPPDKMQGFLDYACGKVDCGPIKPGGACFDPDFLFIRTSFALDQLYRSTNFCNLDIGQITTQDPSFPGCQFP
ncbi:hypothetical protein BUALT_Bualt07G0119800 [Buddleja alternifolia]|uniref:X8 domain-containing protein n=1 Tax=Buddleja alternifolia TaxID=168488 RepID=A0AAV6XEI4_9LAMI|nr:hypothetical protein BUALT_Bualt07G0119800 [Buddleja alternifolia]